MTHDANPAAAILPGSIEHKRRQFLRYLADNGWINETSVVDERVSGPYRLPSPVPPTFPIAAHPERVEGA